MYFGITKKYFYLSAEWVDWGALIKGPFPIGYVNAHLLCLGAGL